METSFKLDEFEKRLSSDDNFKKNYKQSHGDICKAIAERDSSKAFKLREEQLLISARDSYGKRVKDLLAIFDF